MYIKTVTIKTYRILLLHVLLYRCVTAWDKPLDACTKYVDLKEVIHVNVFANAWFDCAATCAASLHICAVCVRPVTSPYFTQDALQVNQRVRQ